jgi:hypothetical protein
MQNLTCVEAHTVIITQAPQQPSTQDNQNDKLCRSNQSSSRLGRGEFRCAQAFLSQQVHVHADTDAGTHPLVLSDNQGLGCLGSTGASSLDIMRRPSGALRTRACPCTKRTGKSQKGGLQFSAVARQRCVYFLRPRPMSPTLLRAPSCLGGRPCTSKAMRLPS